jgi:hypothetical protein
MGRGDPEKTPKIDNGGWAHSCVCCGVSCATMTLPPPDDDPFFAPDPPPENPRRNNVLALVLGAVLLLAACVTGRFTYDGLGSVDDPPTTGPTPTVRAEDLLAPALPQVMASPFFAVSACVTVIGLVQQDVSGIVVPCRDQHVGEVFATISIAGDDYPGDDAMATGPDDCEFRLRTYADPKKTKGMHVYAQTPTRSTWLLGDRTVYCFVGKPDGTKGSVQKKS